MQGQIRSILIENEGFDSKDLIFRLDNFFPYGDEDWVSNYRKYRGERADDFLYNCILEDARDFKVKLIVGLTEKYLMKRFFERKGFKRREYTKEKHDFFYLPL